MPFCSLDYYNLWICKQCSQWLQSSKQYYQRDPSVPWILMTYESANSVRERTSNWGRYPPLDKVGDTKKCLWLGRSKIDKKIKPFPWYWGFFDFWSNCNLTQSSPLRQMFNRTMSLRQDSDIVVGWNKVLNFQKKYFVAVSNSCMRSSLETEKYLEIVDIRVCPTSYVAWVSFSSFDI